MILKARIELNQWLTSFSKITRIKHVKAVYFYKFAN